MNWLRVAFMHMNTEWGNGFADNFQSAIAPLGVKVAASMTLPVSPALTTVREKLLQIKESGARIIVIAALVPDMTIIWPIAKSLGMTQLPYVWLGVDADPGYLTASSSTRNDYVGLISAKAYQDPNNPVYQLFLARWLQKYRQNPRSTYNVSEPSSWSVFQYDAVWAVAHAIKSMMPVWNFSSTNETYKLALRQQLLRTLYALNFTGASGPFSLDSEGDRGAFPIGFYNLRPDPSANRLTWAQVGLFKQAVDLSWQSVSFDTLAVTWPGGRTGVTPLDRPSIILGFTTISSLLFWFVLDMHVLVNI
jgi:ABC-type branched-subunit amino acid transport system substrate-binding protein